MGDMSMRTTSTPGSTKRSRGSRSVPVRQRIEIEGVRRQRRSKTRNRASRALSVPETLLYLVVAFVALGVIAFPLRTYMQQRAEIAELRTSVAAKQEEKTDLEKELARNTSSAYREEQTRRQLGAINPGETAFRIVDPAMTNPDQVTSKGIRDDGDASQQWYVTVWRSIMDPRAQRVAVNDPNAQKPSDIPDHTPNVPAPQPVEGQQTPPPENEQPAENGH